jgi:hypothetical protein
MCMHEITTSVLRQKYSQTVPSFSIHFVFPKFDFLSLTVLFKTVVGVLNCIAVWIHRL